MNVRVATEPPCRATDTRHIFGTVFLATSPRFMNYHAEHHLLPSVPYYNLRRLHDVINARMAGKREEHDLRYLFSRAFWSNVNTTSRQHLRESVTG